MRLVTLKAHPNLVNQAGDDSLINALVYDPLITALLVLFDLFMVFLSLHLFVCGCQAAVCGPKTEEGME